MKFLHLSDLHIGKRFSERSFIEDQEYILKKINNIIDDEKPDAVVIAGDVYDKSVPSAEAVQLFDDFLCGLAMRKLQVFIISGNHDSAERMAFGGRLMEFSGVHISPVYNGKVEPVSLEDKFGKVNFWMLPFVKPGNVRRYFEDAGIESYTDAVRVAIENMNVNSDERNVIITHQFVTGATKGGSEEGISVGGTDNVDVSVFDCFDYVALGHIHGPQNIKSERIRYCGTPLKYSFSESKHKKSVTIVEMGKKGELEIRTVALEPKRDMREIRGTYNEIMLKENYEGTNTDDYIHITLTDEDDIPGVIGKLRVVYPNIMKLDYDNKRTRNTAELDTSKDYKEASPYDVFAEFYEIQNGQPMNKEQSDYIKELIEKVKEGER